MRAFLFHNERHISLFVCIIGFILDLTTLPSIDHPLTQVVSISYFTTAARRARDLSASGVFLPLFASVAPLVTATLGLGLAYLIGLGEGDAILFITLAASASYIAVPAAMRLAMPEANPSLYVSMALAVTFPFNIMIGIPLYVWVVRWLWG